MSVVLYYMNGCPYCVKAKNMLQNEINSGEIIMKPSSEAPRGVNGFPYFLNLANGLDYPGCPDSKMALYNKLRVGAMATSEGYQNNRYQNAGNNNICSKCHLPRK